MTFQMACEKADQYMKDHYGNGWENEPENVYFWYQLVDELDTENRNEGQD